ncbi:hypothetical protein O181_031082 [Austropuccinia psidii MF-1]|uniref:Uncharacterized protein n=1 Tax=Austropuccinia psidii MF-1 TaxID=1389203 RepID=A0A9Q3H508_9BASI|nr:hypothetical protein [Austropuccinia psidii MF-1]
MHWTSISSRWLTGALISEVLIQETIRILIPQTSMLLIRGSARSWISALLAFDLIGRRPEGPLAMSSAARGQMSTIQLKLGRWIVRFYWIAAFLAHSVPSIELFLVITIIKSSLESIDGFFGSIDYLQTS